MKPGALILIIVISIMVLIVSLRSCEDEEYFEDTEIENSTDTIAETIPEFPYGKPVQDYEVPKKDIPSKEKVAEWPDSIYNSVEGYPFLNDIQREVIIEVNKCRTNPSRYADEVLEPFLKSMKSNGTFVDSNGINIITKEGKPAIKEAITALRNKKPCSILKPQNYLCKGALDHCNDHGPHSYVGHDGTDRSSPTDRARRYNSECKGVGENIQYGSSTGKEIVRDLIIDDGVASRGHRKNFYEDYLYIGVGFGPHAGFGNMCVIDFE